MKFIRSIWLVAIAMITLSSAAQAGENIAVLELFTAAGCGNTIAADQAFEKIVAPNHENLIALSCHITFFNDRIDDPHSRHFCDYRYDEYSQSVMNEATTPQVVVNGRFDTKGDREHIVRDALTLAHALDTIEKIQLDLTAQTLNITLPEIRTQEKPIDVWLFAYVKRADEKTLGELVLGHKSSYVNIATHGKKLIENWDGQYRNINVQRDKFLADGYAVLAQYADHTDIIAAGKIEKP